MNNTQMEQINITFIAIESETEKALQVKFEGRTEWMPKSQVTINEDNTIEMPKWLAEKKHLVENAADRRTDRMFANMKKEIEAANAKMNAEQKAEVEAIAEHNAIYKHYDAKRGEYFAIVNNKRYNA